MAGIATNHPSLEPGDHYFWSSPDARRWTGIVTFGLAAFAMVAVPTAFAVQLLGMEKALALAQILLGATLFALVTRNLFVRWRRWRAPVLSTMESALAHVEPHFASAERERAVIIGIGSDHGVVFEHVIEGDRLSVSIDVRDLLGRALRADAAVLLMFHNHPDERQAVPSHADNAFTNRIVRASRDVGLAVVDHIIVAGDDHYSYWRQGTLRAG